MNAGARNLLRKKKSASYGDDASEVWRPFQLFLVAVLFVGALVTFITPTIAGVIVNYHVVTGDLAAGGFSKLIKFMNDSHSPASFLTDYWPALPGLAAGVAISFPRYRRLIVLSAGIIFFINSILSSIVLYWYESIDLSNKVQLLIAINDIVTGEPPPLDHFWSLVERTRDISIAFISALVGGVIGGGHIAALRRLN